MGRHSLVQTFSYKRPSNIRDSEKIWLLLDQSDTLGLFRTRIKAESQSLVFFAAFIHANAQKLKHDRPTHPNHPFRESFQVPNREHETNELANSPQTPKLMILVGEQERDSQESPHPTLPVLPEGGGPSGHLPRHLACNKCGKQEMLQQTWKATVSYSTCPACAAKCHGVLIGGALLTRQSHLFAFKVLHSQTYPSSFRNLLVREHLREIKIKKNILWET